MGQLDEVSKSIGFLTGSAERTERNVARIFERLDALPCKEHEARISRNKERSEALTQNNKTVAAKSSLLAPTWTKAIVASVAAAVMALLSWLTALLKSSTPGP